MVVATGFTNIIDIAVDSAGGAGRLVRVNTNGTQTVLSTAGLGRPGGIAIGPDGALCDEHEHVRRPRRGRSAGALTAGSRSMEGRGQQAPPPLAGLRSPRQAVAARTRSATFKTGC